METKSKVLVTQFFVRPTICVSRKYESCVEFQKLFQNLIDICVEQDIVSVSDQNNFLRIVLKRLQFVFE